MNCPDCDPDGPTDPAVSACREFGATCAQSMPSNLSPT